MGSGRRTAKSIRALPAGMDPVKATAFTSGCCTSLAPTSVPESNKRENTPSGKPWSRTASRMARPTSSLVPGWAGCALTITGFPAAKEEAVSPPATEKASGKLLAPKTTTGPRGCNIERISGLGKGLRSGAAWSIRAETQEPSSMTEAMHVRAVSDFRRGSGRAVSLWARAISKSVIDSR